MAGHGTVVTGTVASGSVAVGDELEWQPAGKAVRVRGLHRHDRPVERIGRGSRAAINLVGVHHTEVRRGQELAAPGYLRGDPHPLGRGRGLGRGHPAAAAPGPIQAPPRDGRGLGRAVPARSERAGAGWPQLAQLFLAEPVVAVHGQPFVLREESPPATLGGGRVLQPVARRIRRRDQVADRPAGPASLGRPGRSRCARHWRSWGSHPGPSRRSARWPGCRSSEVAAVLDQLTASGALVELPVGPRRTVRVLAEFVADLEDRVLRALGRLHAARPRQSAIPRAHLAAELPDLASEALVAGIIERLKAQGKVVAEPRTVAVTGCEPKLSQGERRLKKELAEAIRTGGMSPPDAAELAARRRPRAAVVPELLALLRDEQRVVEIASSALPRRRRRGRAPPQGQRPPGRRLGA